MNNENILYGWDLTTCHDEQRKEWRDLTSNCGNYHDSEGRILFILAFPTSELFHNFLINKYAEIPVLREIRRPMQRFRGFDKI